MSLLFRSSKCRRCSSTWRCPVGQGCWRAGLWTSLWPCSVMAAFMAWWRWRWVFAAFSGIFRTPREGWSPVLVVALTPGVSPRCQATGRVHANSFLSAGLCGCGQTHSLSSCPKQQQQPTTNNQQQGVCPQECLFFASPVEEWTLAADGCTRLWSRAAAKIATTASCSSAWAAVDRNFPGVSTSPFSRQDDRGPAQRPTGTEERRHRVLRAVKWRWGACEGFPATLSGWAAGTTGSGSAAHRGADCRFRPSGTDSGSCWAVGGTVAERPSILPHALAGGCRACFELWGTAVYRRAQDLTWHDSAALGGLSASTADGRTVGGSRSCCWALVAYACARHWVERHRRPRAVYKYWAQLTVWTSLRPCTTSSSSCRSTVDASLQFIDRVVDVAVMLQSQARTVSNCAFLDWFWHARCCACQGRWQPCHGAEVVSLGPVQQTTEIPQLCSTSLLCKSSILFGCRPWEFGRDPTVALVAFLSGRGRSHARCVQRQMPRVRLNVVHASVMQVQFLWLRTPLWSCRDVLLLNRGTASESVHQLRILEMTDIH